mmetsp:Transcript_164910/g.316657  ORF Transcript_164910/g.316657 Transcript_164910/m.316657 type:complete len:103 (+) Transcript_164910:178-486(+)
MERLVMLVIESLSCAGQRYEASLYSENLTCSTGLDTYPQSCEALLCQEKSAFLPAPLHYEASPCPERLASLIDLTTHPLRYELFLSRKRFASLAEWTTWYSA